MRVTTKQRPDNRHGFTTIELLVTMGILLILTSLVAVGVANVLERQKAKNTRITFATGQSMLSEYQEQVGFSEPFGEWLVQTGPAADNVAKRSTGPAGALEFNYWDAPDIISGSAMPINVPESVNQDNPEGQDARMKSAAVVSTQLAISRMRQAPLVRQIIDGVPESNRMVIEADTSVWDDPARIPQGMYCIDGGQAKRFVGGSWEDVSEAPPVLLDGWQNPIILVPATGMIVDVDGDGTLDVNAPIRAPGNVPFFASAGPDGNFQTHEDNLYSFDN
ncbi:MAG: type II secretion system protein [Phycisphaerae bacterium]